MEAWKLAATLAFILAIGGLAWLVEYLTDRYRPDMSPVARFLVLFLLALAIGFAALQLANARDLDGRYAASPLKPWFDQLKSNGGALCCSDADGTALSDVDWETKDGRCRVRIEGEWIDVPDAAVITEPNRAGRTMVWPVRGYMGMTIRCFMPGSMT